MPICFFSLFVVKSLWTDRRTKWPKVVTGIESHGCGKTLWTITVHTFGKLKARLFAFSGARILFIQSKHVVSLYRARSGFAACWCWPLCPFDAMQLVCGGDVDIFNVCFQFLCLHHYVLHTLCLHKSMANIWFVLFLSSLLDLCFVFFLFRSLGA